MRPLSPRTVMFLVLDAALLLLCVLHFPALLRSVRLPFDAGMAGERIEVQRILDPDAAGGLAPGDRLVRWNSDSLLSRADLQFWSDFSVPGEKVRLELEGGRVLTVTCIPSYDAWYLIVVLLVGLVSAGVGVFVLLQKPDDPAAIALHWSLVSIGISTMITTGSVAGTSVVQLVSRGAFFVVYMGVASFFLFFTWVFPRRGTGRLWVRAVTAFAPAAVLVPGLIWTHLSALKEHSVTLFRTFQVWFDVFHVVLLLYVIAGLYNVARAYAGAETRAERQKLQWIIWGLAIGPTPFLLLVVVPQLFRPSGWIPEGVAELFFLFIPVSFAIAFVKYHALDIEVVIKRTTVYALAVGGVVVLYSAVVGTASALAGAYLPGVGAFAAVAAALLFHPVRMLVQRWVDRKFFRVTYDFREAGRMILRDIERAQDESQLAELLTRRADELIPVERIALLEAPEGGGVRVIGGRDLEDTAWTSPCAWGALERASRVVHATDGAVEAGVPCVPLEPDLRRRERIAALFPIAEGDGRVRGCIVAGPKRSGARFTAEDVDLMLQVSAETGLALQRIRLQRRLVTEQAAARRLEELNRMKSDFVSYVSHELRTPLTSIKMFAEILTSPRLRLGQTARGYVRIIEGESERLSRMVTTILDSAKIEQGMKEYRPVAGDLRIHVRRALATMTYQLDQHRFRWRLLAGRRPLKVNADPDAVVQAVVNLVANAIKYSGRHRELTVRLWRRNGQVRCSVRDRGRGIPEELQGRLFERFYRAPEARREAEGVGLGLPLVKHIMEAHGGAVEVSSAVGKGSTFTLVFPEQQSARFTTREISS